MPNRYYTSHSEIQGYGDPAVESASATVVQPGENKQVEVGGVFKDGLIVSGHIAQELSKDPASEFFYFQQIQGTDQYHMKPKYPEEIADFDGTRIKFRKNVNYFFKAVGRSVIGDDGSVNLQKGDAELNQMLAAVDYGDKAYQDALFQYIKKNGNVAKEDEESLEQFCRAQCISSASNAENSGILNGLTNMPYNTYFYHALSCMNVADKLKQQRARDGQLSEEDQKKLESYELEAENRLDLFRFWAGLDPESHMDMIANPNFEYGNLYIETAIKGANRLHPDREIAYHRAKQGQSKEIKRYCDDLEQFYFENPDDWDEIMGKNGSLPENYQAKKTEYEEIENRRESLLAKMQKLQKSDMTMYEELLEIRNSLHGKNKEDLEAAYDRSIQEVQRKMELDKKENPDLRALNEQYMQLEMRSRSILSDRKRIFRNFCSACKNGEILLDGNDPKQKVLLEKVEVLKKRGIEPAVDYYGDVPAVQHDKPDDYKVYETTGLSKTGLQIDVAIDGQKRNLAMEVPWYKFDPEKLKGQSTVAIGILKDDEEYRKYTVSGPLTKRMDMGWYKERDIGGRKLDEIMEQFKGYRSPNSVGIRELRSMSGEQVLARLTGVIDTSADRFDSYVQGLKGFMINGQSALHYLGMEDLAGGGKVSGDHKKEQFIAGMGEVIKERLLDQLQGPKSGERSDRFTVTMEGRGGSYRPLNLHFEEEVRPPEREVTKPGTLWKFFHSKSAIERRMNEYHSFRKQREEYETYQRQKAAVEEYNRKSNAAADDEEYFRKSEELERSVKESAPKAKKSAEKNVEYLAFSEFKDKEWESRLPVAQKNSKSVDMKKSEEKTLKF